MSTTKAASPQRLPSRTFVPSIAHMILWLSLLCQYVLLVDSDSQRSIRWIDLSSTEVASMATWVVLLTLWLWGAAMIVYFVAQIARGPSAVGRWVTVLFGLSVPFNIASGWVGLESSWHGALQVLWVAVVSVAAWRHFRLSWKPSMTVFAAVGVYCLVTISIGYAALGRFAPVDGGLGR